MKHQIVKFKDGTHGVRKDSSIGFQYLDLETPKYWWPLGSEYQPHTKGTLEACHEALQEHINIFDEGEPI